MWILSPLLWERNWNKQQVKSTPAIDPGLYLPEALALHSLFIQILLDMVCIDFHHRWNYGIQNFCPPLKWLNQPHAAMANMITLLMMKPSVSSPNSFHHFQPLQKTFPSNLSFRLPPVLPPFSHLLRSPLRSHRAPSTLPTSCWTFSEKPRLLTQKKILQIFGYWVICGWFSNCSWESSPTL